MTSSTPSRLPKQRHTLRHLFWRSVVAGGGNAAILSGLYVVLPELSYAVLQGTTRRPNRRLVRTLAAEWASSVAVALARPVGHFGFPEKWRRSHGRPVLLIHGYAMNRANFLLLARRLSRAELGPLLGFEYWTLGSVAGAAKQLRSYVEGLVDTLGCDGVDIVGHSMGGIVGRYYVSFGGGEQHVRNLITIGSPHQGTKSSRFGVGWARRELSLGSPIMQRLAAAPRPTRTRLTSIWSYGDSIVCPAESCHLEGAEEEVFGDLGHLSLLTSRRVAAAIIGRLKR